MIQDIFPHKLENQYRPEIQPEQDSYVLCYRGAEVLLKDGEMLPTVSEVFAEHYRYLFQIDNRSYFLPETPVSENDAMQYEKIRRIRGAQAIPQFQRYAIMTGKHLADWYKSTRYCGRCGGVLHHSAEQRAMVCDHCHKSIYPKIMPAVIVGVISGDSLLLTKYRTGFPYFALVAGFTEIGETLEETVEREVMEETGLHVQNIRYYKSQPWGIANDILAGFYCEVDGDPTIQMDTSELKYASGSSGRTSFTAGRCQSDQ